MALVVGDQGEQGRSIVQSCHWYMLLRSVRVVLPEGQGTVVIYSTGL